VAGGHAAEDGGGFSGQHEPDEQGVLGEDEQPDDQVQDQTV
jgi:hypothetical protein